MSTIGQSDRTVKRCPNSQGQGTPDFGLFDRRINIERVSTRVSALCVTSSPLAEPDKRSECWGESPGCGLDNCRRAGATGSKEAQRSIPSEHRACLKARRWTLALRPQRLRRADRMCRPAPAFIAVAMSRWWIVLMRCAGCQEPTYLMSSCSGMTLSDEQPNLLEQ